MLIIVTILLNVGAIAAWSFITGQNGFKEAAKMLRGEPAFVRDSNTSINARNPTSEEVAEDIEKEGIEAVKDRIDWEESVRQGETIFE